MRLICRFGSDIEPHWRQLAALRIEVFREFPYLYEGGMEYEREYLQAYIDCPLSLVLLLLDDLGQAVGASTALPLGAAGPEFQQAFNDAHVSVEGFLYLGESVLHPDLRGQGWGHRFFDERERHARALGFRGTCFCAVERPLNHPARPSGYRSHDKFWAARGYRRHAELRTQFSWRDLDSSAETFKPMVFWLRTTEEAGQASQTGAL